MTWGAAGFLHGTEIRNTGCQACMRRLVASESLSLAYMGMMVQADGFGPFFCYSYRILCIWFMKPGPLGFWGTRFTYMRGLLPRIGIGCRWMSMSHVVVLDCNVWALDFELKQRGRGKVDGSQYIIGMR